MRYALLCLLMLICLGGITQLSVDQPIMNDMVLQRGKPLLLSGKSKPNGNVKIYMGAAHKSEHNYVAAANNKGEWKITIPAHAASFHAFTIAIYSHTDSIVYNNLLWGDVWLCAGQSNMEFPLKNEMHYKLELPIMQNPAIRMYNPNYIGKNRYANPYPDSVKRSLTASKFYNGSWQILDSLAAPGFSAIGYYFAKIIAQKVKVPIGIINVSVGGSPIEAWMSEPSLIANKNFSNKINGSWLTNNNLPVWIRQRGIENIGITNTNGNHAFKPGFLYEAAIRPLSLLPITGILWYQGESNAQEMERVNEYEALQSIMINSYRNAWRQTKLPFYFVQLSSIDTAKYKSHFWQAFRAVQYNAFKNGHDIGMAISMDIGAKNDVHPTNKKLVAERLANWALQKQYAIKDMPTITKLVGVTCQNNQVVVTFSGQVQVLNNQIPLGFSLDGITEAAYTIKDNVVFISASAKPKEVYFGFSPYTSANLVDKDGVPIPAFNAVVK
ncbi:MAG: sialate O-acetylesterase [Sediminibacterium sp.]